MHYLLKMINTTNIIVVVVYGNANVFGWKFPYI